MGRLEDEEGEEQRTEEKSTMLQKSTEEPGRHGVLQLQSQLLKRLRLIESGSSRSALVTQ